MYQILHPWHWLTYGQNATGVGDVVAILGLIGLAFYTLYTRQMMKMQTETALISITPMLVIEGGIEYTGTDARMIEVAPGAFQPRTLQYKLVLKIKNIGEGAALFIRAWYQPVSEKFVSDGAKLIQITANARQSNSLGHLQKSEVTSLVVEGLGPEDVSHRRLIVVEAIDRSSIPHQLQIVQTPIGPGKVETSVIMFHADPQQFRKHALKRARPL